MLQNASMESEVSPKPIPFSKYVNYGAYHWAECDRSSPRYNQPLEAGYKVLIRRLESAKRVLDVGCGDGYLMSLVSPLCDQVVGIDSEPTGIRLAADKLLWISNCRVAQASCYQLPFADRCFDLVLLTDVIEHLESPEPCLQEISRVLTPTGTVLLTTPKWRPDRMWDHLHYKEYKPEELEACLQAYFSQVTMTFFWPVAWYRTYATRFGCRLIRLFSRHFLTLTCKKVMTRKITTKSLLCVCPASLIDALQMAGES